MAVTDPAQTEQFFTASFGQYEGVTAVDHELRITAQTKHSVWADVTWSYDGHPPERSCYQLINAAAGPQIAVPTRPGLTFEPGRSHHRPSRHRTRSR